MGQSHVLGKQAEEQILAFLAACAGQVEPTHQSEFLQALWGDYVITKGGEPCAIELKAERFNRYGNFFLETWSNRQWFTLGWLYKLRGDYLFYMFIDSKELWTISTPALKRWAFGVEDQPGQIYQYPERKQAKYEQKNDSWGRCVPIVNLQNALGGDIKHFRL
ncbi:MAG: hypothetical protein EBR82_67370 [Caulobacteraceae bacterium]|nr:hypothetical protein [Caulobacteraceae bacterium]